MMTTPNPQHPADLQYKLNSNLTVIKTWLQANKLSLNVKETKYSIIGSHNELANLNYQFDVKSDAKTYTYMSIDLDGNLSWDSHWQRCQKLSASLVAIRWVRILFHRETLITL